MFAINFNRYISYKTFKTILVKKSYDVSFRNEHEHVCEGRSNIKHNKLSTYEASMLFKNNILEYLKLHI